MHQLFIYQLVKGFYNNFWTKVLLNAVDNKSISYFFHFQCDSGVGSSDGFLSTSPLPMLRHQQQHEEDDVAVTGFSPPRAFSHPMLSSLTTTHALPANAFSDLSLPHQSNRNLDLDVPSQGDIGHVLADNCFESPSMRQFNVAEFGSRNGKVKVGAEGRKWPLTTALSMIDVTTSSDEEVCDLLSSQGPYLLLLPPTDNNSCTSIEHMSTNVKKRGSLSVMSSWSSEGEVDSLRCVSPCKRHCSAADISPAAAQSHQHPLQQEPSPSDHSVWEDFRRDQRPCLDFEKMIKVCIIWIYWLIKWWIDLFNWLGVTDVKTFVSFDSTSVWSNKTCTNKYNTSLTTDFKKGCWVFSFRLYTTWC